jgi:hypothetical protein
MEEFIKFFNYIADFIKQIYFLVIKIKKPNSYDVELFKQILIYEDKIYSLKELDFGAIFSENDIESINELEHILGIKKFVNKKLEKLRRDLFDASSKLSREIEIKVYSTDSRGFYSAKIRDNKSIARKDSLQNIQYLNGLASDFIGKYYVLINEGKKRLGNF